MKVNIDRKGRIARAVSGTLCILLGLTLSVTGYPESPRFRSVICGILLALGGFQWFEARKGWCAARACGLKTPM